MKRREFLRTGCIAGIGLAGTCLLMTGCKTVHVNDSNGEIKIPLSKFKNRNALIIDTQKKGKIIVLKKTENTFKALSMQCTHKGVLLQQENNLLVCPSHGSVFDLDGHVTSAPARVPLHSYLVTIRGTEIVINLL